jgi:hypothetical protein
VERVRLYPGKMDVRAKLDTGAKTSSLHAEEIVLLREGDEQWVDFIIVDRRGERRRMRRPVDRMLRIRRAVADLHQRPVVTLGICLGTHYGQTKVSLVDRSYMNYEMLLGRDFLLGKVLIDPSRTFATKPLCRRPKESV